MTSISVLLVSQRGWSGNCVHKCSSAWSLVPIRMLLRSKSMFDPGVNAAVHWVDIRHAESLQLQCHTGTRCFVWSATVKNDFAVFGYAMLIQVYGFHGDTNCGGYHLWLVPEVKVMAQVDDVN